MKRVEVGGVIHENASSIRDNVVCFYENLYQETRLGGLRLMGWIFTPLGLMRPFYWNGNLTERRCSSFLRIFRVTKRQAPIAFPWPFSIIAGKL
jgi:hypothetical protein